MEYIKETELVLVSILMKLGQKPLKFSKENIAVGKIFLNDLLAAFLSLGKL